MFFDQPNLKERCNAYRLADLEVRSSFPTLKTTLERSVLLAALWLQESQIPVNAIALAHETGLTIETASRYLRLFEQIGALPRPVTIVRAVAESDPGQS